MVYAKIWFCVLSQLVVVVFPISVEDEVQTLKSQVNALLQRRQEDYNQLEESLRRTLDKNIEISNLKNEIKELRVEIETLRADQCNNCANGNRLKNEQLTVQWLANSITEIRSEISELAQSFNSTIELQQQQALSTDISIIQNDIVSLRHDLESFKGEFVKAGAKLATMSQDIDISRQLSHSTAAVTTNLTEKLQVAISEWTTVVKNIQRRKDKVFKRMVIVNEDPLDMKVITMANSNVRNKRHNKEVLKQMIEIKEELKTLQMLNKHMKHDLLILEEKLAATGSETETRLRDEFTPQFAKIEEVIELLTENVSILGSQMSGQEKLHTSMLELLESVENIETKVDSTTPDLKREISKLEFNLAQITSATSLLKEDQDNQRISVKALSESLSTMQDKTASYQNQITNINERLINISTMPAVTMRKYNSENETLHNDSCFCNLNIENTLKKLSAIHSQYSNIVNKLPKDCSSVNGASGLYLISPDDTTPLLVYCEIKISESTKTAYTVIQRRMNGMQDFNKNWEEYARGFGDPNGEFWLGNEAIYRLTKDNNTQVRIDFKDISGKSWYAEYNEFSVASKEEGYRLHVAGYNGNASDALEYQNRMQFSTVDSDRDISNTNCAANYEGGWWFSHCQHTNLNGKYNLGLTWFDLSRNEWIAVAFTEIKILKKTS